MTDDTTTATDREAEFLHLLSQVAASDMEHVTAALTLIASTALAAPDAA